MNRSRVSLIPAVVLIGAAGALARADESAYEKLIQQRGGAIVTVKFVLKVSAQGRERESDGEVSGAMIDARGLVLCSNTQLGGLNPMMRRMVGDLSITPTELKVLVAPDTVGAEATLIARDTELDLAWVQINEPAAAPYAFIDFDKPARAGVGTKVLSLKRMGRFYERALLVGETRVGGTLKKPRDLLVLTTADGSLGLPVFTADGAVIGVSIVQAPESEDAGGMFGNMSDVQVLAGSLILPAADVAKATARAREVAAGESAAPPTPPTSAPKP